MKNILAVVTLLLIVGLSGCFIGGPGTIKLYVDDEVYATFKEDVMNIASLDIPQKEGMMFTGWEYQDEVVFDSIEVTGNMKLYATWEDPSEVFGFNEDPLVEYDGQYITSYSGDAIHMRIPVMINGEYVSGIGREVFLNKSIQTIFVPMDTNIMSYAFKDSDLERIEFYGEYQIPAEVFIPKSEFDQIIEDYTDECIVEIGGNDESWTYTEGCPILEVIEQSEPIVINEVEYFNYRVLIDKNVYSIGDRSQIDFYAFVGATQLRTVEIPYGMDSFFQAMFEECSELETILLDERNISYKIVDGIVYSANETMLYYYPAGLKNETFTVPENVINIHMHAFLTTTYLKTLYINASIDENLFFFGAESLEEIIVDEANETYYSIDGVLFEDDELLKYPASKSNTSYVISEGITVIRSCAFMDNRYLEEIEISSTVTTIEANAFWKSQTLTTLDIPSTITLIHQGIVHESAINTIIIRRSVETDGDITHMLYLLYNGSEFKRTIYVPDDSFIAYSTDEFWSNHIDDLEAYQEME